MKIKLTRTEIENVELRALEPVTRCLIQHLMVPTVYWEAPWGGGKADLLAVDRAGTGDVHLVEIKIGKTDLDKTICQLRKRPADYRWIAYFPEKLQKVDPEKLPKRLFDAVPGRIGVIQLFMMANQEIGARILIKAEKSFVLLNRDLVDKLQRRRPHYKVE
jgi:hypothetical protein